MGRCIVNEQWCVCWSYLFGHVSTPAFGIWRIVSWKIKKDASKADKNKISHDWTKYIWNTDHLDIVFWTLIFPFSLLFQRNSRSEREYFPLSHTFSKNWTFTLSTVGLQGHERRCLRTLVSFVQCSLNLTQFVTVVFPAYWSTHLQVIPYMPESLQLTLGLIWYFFFPTELTTHSGSPLALFLQIKQSPLQSSLLKLDLSKLLKRRLRFIASICGC